MSEFYQQIALIKTWICDQELNRHVMNILQQNTIPTNKEKATAISLMLTQWIEIKRLKYRSVLTEREFQIFDRACFAMISLADELLIMIIPWPGKEHWHDVLLEQHSYQSCSAGVMFYRYIDELLVDKNFDDLKKQLAGVYLLAMRLGFAGRYRDNKSELNDYSKKLFSLLKRDEKSSSDFISTEAYKHNLKSQNEQRLAPLSNWYRGITYSLVAYSLIGIALWYSITWSLNQWIVG